MRVRWSADAEKQLTLSAPRANAESLRAIRGSAESIAIAAFASGIACLRENRAQIAHLVDVDACAAQPATVHPGDVREAVARRIRADHTQGIAGDLLSPSYAGG